MMAYLFVIEILPLQIVSKVKIMYGAGEVVTPVSIRQRARSTVSKCIANSMFTFSKLRLLRSSVYIVGICTFRLSTISTAHVGTPHFHQDVAKRRVRSYT